MPKKKKPVITIGIDSSTTNCGTAIYENGKLVRTKNYEFSGRYTLTKLEKITKTFNDLFDELTPDMIILEKPAPVRNSRTLTSLNQVAGAIWGVATAKGIFIDQMHNKTIKKMMDVKSKDDAIKVVSERFGMEVETDHEADAVLTVEAYKIHIDENGSEEKLD